MTNSTGKNGERTRRVLDEARGVRAMVWIIAIMLFLTVLGAALGLATRNAAGALETQLVGRATVQIMAADPARREAEVGRAVATLQKLPAVRSAALVDRDELAALLRPWLGDDGADPELPIPAMIDLELADDTAAALARVRASLQSTAPSARIDAHEAWMAPVAGFLNLVVSIAAVLVLLLAGATAAVVMLAARAGLDAHRQTIEVMHMLGSTDLQVARLFQRRIARDAAIGAAIGSLAAIGMLLLVSGEAAGLGSQLLGGATLGMSGWAVLAMLPIAFVLLAALAARFAITRALERVL
ncbi:cell division protein FtsX [Sphingomonas jeddahensis]|uniref:Cell division ABC transporter subunit FtsX n=1 Tax=Sphingomonas jeddahensis TaxID=1915074 RepID=A0A1V2EQG2_9SPHN|nr:permease [Sphingomonas jeddahensis]ONF94921.1 cell division ABC transporter subunit FtsX [Sphingomonas jeddahensis]